MTPRRGQRRLLRLGARLPIRWRLALLTFGLLALLLAALGAIVSLSEERTLLANQANALRQDAALFAGALHNSDLSFAHHGDSHPPSSTPLSGDQTALLTALANQLTGPNTRGVLYGPSGSLLVTGSDPVGSPPGDDRREFGPASVSLDDAIIQAAVRDTPAVDAYALAKDDNDQIQLVVMLPIEQISTQTTVAVLQISTPASPIISAVQTTRLVLGVGIAIALLIAAAVMFPLLSAGLRPLVAMERTSERIAAGALSLRLEEPPTHDEIGRFARSFNLMVAQLEAAFKRQKQFVADVSHELRTPLTSLGGGLEMLMLGANRGDAEAAHRLTRGMYREVERMQRLVEDLLTLTHLDEGRLIVHVESVAVGPLLAEVAEQAGRVAGDRRIEAQAPPDVPPVLADPDRLRQVILNLVDNAIKYTPDDGTIRLTAQASGARHVEIQVRDTGVGIPADALPHVFERFYRADASRARSQRGGGGSGLGLSIAKSMIEAQGGVISIASEPDAGTTVRLRFPRADAPHPDTAAHSTQRATEPSTPPAEPAR
ncbi:MAG TPA: HAMP domain-containing sensor histidine kinase [Ktedonobacterales bacterium]